MMLKAKRRFRFVVIAVAVMIVPVASRAGNLTITPTTTLSAETSNNTSAANNFTAQSNGNLGASNISKLDIHSLLYPAAQTKVFAHMVLWFGQPDHINVGYSSTDSGQVKRQISDMISRGIDGVVMVWYGPNNAIDRAAKLVMHEAETHPGFTFAMMVDNGAIRWDACPGCGPQSALIHDLQYVEQTYFPSPAYLRMGGRPVITNFDIDKYYTVDWSAAKAAMATDPVFLFQNGSGFRHGQSDGAYSWDIATTSDYGMSYLTNFYTAGAAFPSKETWGAAYKGFNDKLASWGLNRFMGQQCGQTWLQTFAKINSLYDSTNQLPVLQLVTWNDYEEGTEIETGIDNCVSVAASVAGNSLQWKITGNENTVDHYTVFISSDGQGLMPIAEMETGSNTLDLCQYSPAAGSYTLFVQANGKPNLSNQMSGALPYTPQCSAPSAVASIALRASPSSVIIMEGQDSSPGIAVTAQSGSASPISLSCSDLPAGMSCTFSPSVIAAGSTGATSVLKVAVTRAPKGTDGPGRPPKKPRKAVLFGLALGMMGMIFVGQLERKRVLGGLVLCGLLTTVLLCSSCGGLANTPASSATAGGVVRGAYAITVNATSGSTQASTTATVTIR
jgi:hypothetical protein